MIFGTKYIARITKLFRRQFKKILVLFKAMFKKYTPRLNIIEKQLLKPQV